MEDSARSREVSQSSFAFLISETPENGNWVLGTAQHAVHDGCETCFTESEMSTLPQRREYGLERFDHARHGRAVDDACDRVFTQWL